MNAHTGNRGEPSTSASYVITDSTFTATTQSRCCSSPRFADEETEHRAEKNRAGPEHLPVCVAQSPGPQGLIASRLCLSRPVKVLRGQKQGTPRVGLKLRAPHGFPPGLALPLGLGSGPQPAPAEACTPHLQDAPAGSFLNQAALWFSYVRWHQSHVPPPPVCSVSRGTPGPPRGI